jgi:hypothetical protein
MELKSKFQHRSMVSLRSVCIAFCAFIGSGIAAQLPHQDQMYWSHEIPNKVVVRVSAKHVPSFVSETTQEFLFLSILNIFP